MGGTGLAGGRERPLPDPTSSQTRKTGADLGQTHPKQLPGVVLAGVATDLAGFGQSG